MLTYDRGRLISENARSVADWLNNEEPVAHSLEEITGALIGALYRIASMELALTAMQDRLDAVQNSLEAVRNPLDPRD